MKSQPQGIGSTRVTESFPHARAKAGAGEVALRGTGLRRRDGSVVEWPGARVLPLRRLQVEGSSPNVAPHPLFFQRSVAPV